MLIYMLFGYRSPYYSLLFSMIGVRKPWRFLSFLVKQILRMLIGRQAKASLYQSTHISYGHSLILFLFDLVMFFFQRK